MHANSNIYNKIYTWYKMLASTGVSLEPLDEQIIVSDTNKMVTQTLYMHSRDTFMLHPNCTQLLSIRLKRYAWFVIARGCRTRALIL